MPTMEAKAALEDIEARLKNLETILATTVFLVDRAEEEESAVLSTKNQSGVAPSQDEGQPLSTPRAVDRATALPAYTSVDLDTFDEMAPYRDTLPYAKLNAQDLSDDDIAFCPWKVVLSYPDCFTGKANRPRASFSLAVRIFFNDVLSYRDWNFFYIRDIKDPSKAHLLVPTRQFQNFLGLINKRLRTELAIPKGNSSRSFFLRFPGCGPFRPRYLVHHRKLDSPSSAARAFSTAAAGSGFDIDDPRTWPRDEADMGSEAWAGLEKDAEARYHANLALLRREPRDNAKTSAGERFERRLARRKKQMEAMWWYLGLQDGAVTGEADVVFCCFDVEAIEVTPNYISEIGVALLDMKRVRGTPPGIRGRGWWSFVEAHHFRIKEYSDLTNYRYIHGCPNDFQFGTSTFPPKEEAYDAVKDLLEPLVSSRRRIVVVGHDLNQDKNYLASMGFDIEYETTCVGTVDSQVLHQAWLKSDSSRGLSSVLNELEFEYSYLHNAGNDAVHTLRAAVGIALAAAMEPEKVEEVPE